MKKCKKKKKKIVCICIYIYIIIIITYKFQKTNNLKFCLHQGRVPMIPVQWSLHFISSIAVNIKKFNWALFPESCQKSTQRTQFFRFSFTQVVAKRVPVPGLENQFKTFYTSTDAEVNHINSAMKH